MTEKEYSREDWQGHYESNDLGWDLGQLAPPFEASKSLQNTQEIRDFGFFCIL